MQSRSQKATYILVPNWTFVPGGPISLGNIIADPFRPHLVLSKAPPSSPHVQRVPQKDWQFGRSSSNSVSTSLWASFAELVSLRLGGSTTRVRDENYSMRELETAYYSDWLDMSTHIKERVNKDPVVREVMRFDNPFSKPVWMVTGIKIARGFRLSSGRERANGVDIEASAPVVVAPVSVGAGVGVEVKRKKDLKFESETDIVFAYQLLKIAPKGWKGKKLEMKEHFAGAAFLSDAGPKEQEVEVEEDLAEVDDLDDFGRDFAQYAKTGDEGEYVCVVAEADSDDEDSDSESDSDG
ncbi:hypothetical protein ABW21_db0203338 [Orbilia brochopaga]|nr:hypothetical protein ABW21_db0203338 [Drechslerella brochopaga]